jgi:hypothetical protein
MLSWAWSGMQQGEWCGMSGITNATRLPTSWQLLKDIHCIKLNLI